MVVLNFVIIPCTTVNAATKLVLYEYLQTAAVSDNSTYIYSANQVAMQFTSNANISHTVEEIRIKVRKNSGGTPGDVKVALHTASGGVPDDQSPIAYGIIDGDSFSTIFDWWSIPFTSSTEGGIPSLEVDTEYAIVVSAPSGDASNYIEWELDSTAPLSGADSSHSTNGGTTWVADGEDALFQIRGTPLIQIISAGVFQNYITNSLTNTDLLITARILNNWYPISEEDLISNNFQMQLIGTDNTTVIAATPMRDWGDLPCSLYVNATVASTMTVSGPYIIRVQGTWVGAPNPIDYTLTPNDWYGKDSDQLKQWIILTAELLESVYGIDLITYQVGKGKILTTEGGAIFTNAIPGITNKLPEIFTFAESKPQYTSGTPTNSYDLHGLPAGATPYRVLLGTDVANDLDAFGAMFGMDGGNFGGILLAILVVIVLIIGLILGGRAGIGLIVVTGLPILFIGNYCGLIGIQWTISLAIILVFIFVWSFYWTRT